MPELIPMTGYYYRAGKKDPKKLKELISPPYDVISDEELKEYKKHPDNICHIILPKTYKDAGIKLREMLGTKLVNYNRRCLWIYGIDYLRPDNGELISRYGFVGLLKLAEIFPAKDGIIPHEMTFKKYTEDRLKIIRETDSNFSPIFTIYDGNGTAEKIIKTYIKKKPFLQTEDRDGFTHRIWDVWKQEDIMKLQEIVKDNSIIIADGHHRYITALRHSREGGCKYIMTLFIDFNDPGLVIFTSHREIQKMSVSNIQDFNERLKNYFIVEKLQDFEALKNALEKNKGKHIFGCYFQKKILFISLKDIIRPEQEIDEAHSDAWKNLNLPILHEILFKRCLKIKGEDISYIKDVKKGIQRVDEGKIQALFIVNPTTLEEIHRITNLGEIMPQKSTYFYPKPLSGLLIHVHNDKI